MSQSFLVDAADEFLRVLRGLSDPTPEEILASWDRFYRQGFPDLHGKQTRDYTAAGEDWREIALTRVFPPLPERLELMEEARTRLARLGGDVTARARAALALGLDVVAVVHMGVGCGAGWATTYGGRPAVLFGLENIAELGWHTEERLAGLIAHELGHLIHRLWRGEPLEELEEDPYGLLYVEGFAQRLEHRILGRESWHLAPDAGWLFSCSAHLAEIARAYRDRVIRGEAVNVFFGSWLSFQGIPFTGHFLGHTVVRALGERRSLPELARLPLADVRASVDRFFRTLEAPDSSEDAAGRPSSLEGLP